MRVTRVALAALLVGVSLLGVGANGAIESASTRTMVSASVGTSHHAPLNRFGHSPPRRPRSPTDLWLMGLVAVTLVGHQMRRKHRFLCPRPFGV